MNSTAKPAASLSARSITDVLEPRRLLSASPVPAAVGDPADTSPPIVVGFRVVGPPDNFTATVVTFSESMDAVRASNPDNYSMYRTRNRKGDEDFFGQTPSENINKHARIDSAVYDDATHSVTLTTDKPFAIKARLRRLAVDANAATGITDAVGNRLDGDFNGTGGDRALLRFAFNTGRRVNYKDVAGDRVSVQLSGPGKLFVLRQPPKGNSNGAAGDATQLWILGGTSASILTGTVKPGKNTDGTASIPLITGLVAGAQDQLSTNPAFVVGAVEG